MAGLGKVLAVTIVEISHKLTAESVAELRQATDKERVVLWLGERVAERIVVRDIFVPIQHAHADEFHIPREGLEQILRHLRARRLMVAAQVHTHPATAFHSEADDRWAIVRHVGALSLVVPCFCQETTTETFVRDAVVFQLSEENEFLLADAIDTYAVTA